MQHFKNEVKFKSHTRSQNVSEWRQTRMATYADFWSTLHLWILCSRFSLSSLTGSTVDSKSCGYAIHKEILKLHLRVGLATIRSSITEGWMPTPHTGRQPKALQAAAKPWNIFNARAWGDWQLLPDIPLQSTTSPPPLSPLPRALIELVWGARLSQMMER